MPVGNYRRFAQGNNKQVRTTQLFNFDWKFHQDDMDNGQVIQFDDAQCSGLT